MSDIQPTTRFASPTVLRFLKEAPEAQRDWYMSRGEPQCLTGDYLVDGRTVTLLSAGLRGIRIGGHVATPEDAIAKAAAFKADLLERPLEPFDEAKAGLDDEARDIADRFAETGARMEAILHIGSMLDGGDRLAEALRDIADDIHHGRKQHRPAAPLLAEIDPGSAERPVVVPEVARDLPILLRLADMGRMTASEILDEFGALAHDDGSMGFLVQISVPEHVPHRDGAGAYVHGGIRRTCWRYGTTYAVAADLALNWVEAEIARMWPGRKAA